MARINLPRQVGIIVAAARESHGLTQLQVAEAAGVSRQLVNRLEVGSATGISLGKLLAILDVVGCALDVYPLEEVDKHDAVFGLTAASANQPVFDPFKEYPLDESLFEVNGEATL